MKKQCMELVKSFFRKRPFLAEACMMLLKQRKRISKRKFKYSMKQYYELNKDGKFAITRRALYPVYTDISQNAGHVDQHYFLQDIYMAKKICMNEPKVHYDIGSRIDGFIAHLLSSGRIGAVVQLDIRPFSVEVPGLDFIKTDATHLTGLRNGSIDSISSLHAIEHFGLGRYGDAIDPYAWKKALQSIQKKLSGGGIFYFSCPIGRQDKLYFNAHRVFKPQTIICVLNQMKLVSFAYVHDYKLYEVPIDRMNSCLQRLGDYDCGLFVFQKT